MWLTAIAIVIVGSGLGMLEIPPLLRRKMKREAWVYGIVLGIGIGLSVLTALKIHYPNPYNVVEWIFRPLSNWIFGPAT